MEKNSKNIMQKGGVQVSKINKYLDNVENIIDESFGVLGFNWVKQDDLIVVINKIRSELPDEISQAADVMSRKDAIVEEARNKYNDIIEDATREADRIIKRAEEESERLVGDTYVMKKANEQAEKAIKDASDIAKNSIAYANNYVENAFDSVLKGIDYLQSDTLDAKTKIIEKLQATEGRYSVAEDTAYQQSYEGYIDEGRKEDIGPYDDYDE